MRVIGSCSHFLMKFCAWNGMDVVLKFIIVYKLKLQLKFFLYFSLIFKCNSLKILCILVWHLNILCTNTVLSLSCLRECKGTHRNLDNL